MHLNRAVLVAASLRRSVRSGGGARATVAALLVAAAVGGCVKDEGSIVLVFPNDVARAAIRRLRVETYSPDAGGVGLSDRTCGLDFLGSAREGQDPLGTPNPRGEYSCPEPCPAGWFESQSLAKVPAGRQIVYVLAYASTADGETPLLEGCSDQFDSREDEGELEDVEVRLNFVIPDNARLAKVGGDRQVGRSDSTLGLPLTVEVRAESPSTGAPYTIPAIPIEFTSLSAGYSIEGLEQAVRTVDADGFARAPVTTPPTTGSGFIRATALPLVGVEGATSSVSFSISVTEATRFAQTEVIQQAGGRPVALAFGRLHESPDVDLAWVTCQGSSADCQLAAEMPNPGAARLGVVRNVGSTTGRRLLPTPEALGILPTDIEMVDMLPPYGVQEVAVLNARRADCQQRGCRDDGLCHCFGLAPGEPCACEGSEIRLLETEGDAVVSIDRYTLTASNGVGMAVMPGFSDGGVDGLVVAGRGRMRNDRPCNSSNTCRQPNITAERQLCEGSPQACGCPPNEYCDCIDCSLGSRQTFCQGEDKSLDFLAARTVNTRDIYNRGGCQNWVRACGGEPVAVRCECRDDNGGSCSASDGCGCIVPVRVRLGELEAPVVPFNIVAGQLRPGEDDDIVVPSADGLELVRRGGPAGFTSQGSPIVNAPIHRAVIAQLDLAAEEDRPAPIVAPDLAWVARSKCTGENYENACPIVDANAGDDPRVGCLGVYYTDGQSSVFRVQTPGRGGCRRHALTFRPDGLCVGRFNDDEHVDVAIAARGVPDLLVFAGDGRGGLLDPPERFQLPDAGGGPVACRDMDGDGLDDIAVFSTNADGLMSGIALLKTRP